jgi:hypothetical protein
MSPLIKVAIAAAAGSFASQYIEPHIVGIVKPDSDVTRKAVSAGSVGLGAAAVYYLIKGT